MKSQSIESFRTETADLEIHNRLNETFNRDSCYSYAIVSTAAKLHSQKHTAKTCYRV